MRINKFLKHIDKLDEDDLRRELKLLYEKLDEVKRFYKFEIGDPKDKEKYYNKIKTNIKTKFATRSFRKPRRPRIQKLHSLLTQLKKDVVFDFELIDIYLYTVESAIEFMHDYYFQSEPLINLINKYFEKACLLIEANLMQNEYQSRVKEIVQKVRLNRALGHECMSIYSKTFEK
jgi:hypothetical protein